MIKIKKIVTKGFASLAALTMLNIGIAPTAYAYDPAWTYDPAHPCAQCGEYDIERPETWRQSSGIEYNGPNFLNEPYNRRVLHPCKDMFTSKGTRKNFEDAGCGTHTWANIMLKTGMAQKGYAAFDAGHYFSCPEYSSENQDTGEKSSSVFGGSDSEYSYCYGPSCYDGDYAKYITKIKNFGAPYAWKDIDGTNDVHPGSDDNYTDNVHQYPSYLTFSGWVRHNLDDDLKNNNALYFTESKAFDKTDIDDFPNSDEQYVIYPTVAQARDINKTMIKHVKKDLDNGYFCTISVRWTGVTASGKKVNNGAHIMCVERIDQFPDGSPRLVLLDSGGGFKYFDDLFTYWKNNSTGEVPCYIYEYYRMKGCRY